MGKYIVCVSICTIDDRGIEMSQITDAYVPVSAESEESACKKAVSWHSDSDTVEKDHDFHWKSNDMCRKVCFKATKCLSVSKDELDTFLCVTQGLSTATVIGDDSGRCGKCGSKLVERDSVQREYVNKDGGDSVFATGHYVDEHFVSDSFSGCDGERYDLLDDSDSCASCDNPL